MKSLLTLRFLRAPLVWKIAGANALLLIALGATLHFAPRLASSPVAVDLLMLGGLVVAIALNVLLITLALRPIQDLERTVTALWSGAVETRAPRSPLADRELTRVAHTLNELLEQLSADRVRLRRVTESLFAARASERAVVSRELTESAAQSAAALALECAALRANGVSRDDWEQRVERVQRAATGLADDLRRIARDLHPRHIEDMGLDGALRTLVREACCEQVQCVYTTHGMVAGKDVLLPTVASTLYDVAREGLQNARRHSRAQRVQVELAVERHMARLSIADDGYGFDLGALDFDRAGGLNAVRERMALVGGTLEIHSQPGKGTRLVAIVPQPQDAVPALRHAEERRSWQET